MQHRAKTEVTAAAEAAAEEMGIYLYCVADSGEKVSLGKIGIEGEEVYTIPYQELCALVHKCPVGPYQSDDQEVVKAWVKTHQRVVDTAWERWGTVLPLTFDTIIKIETEGNAERKVEDWLRQEYEGLKRKLEKVRGKAEYGVQVFWDPKFIALNLTETSPEIKKLVGKIKDKPKGVAYMYQQRLDNLIRHEMEIKADQCFKDFYQHIRKHVDDVRVERTKKAELGLQMILNLSCLVYRERYTELGEELERVNKNEGFSVRFTGPWPPYSFVGSG